MKNSSHIDDKVFLTEEQLIELKLTQKEWVVEIDNPQEPVTLIINRLCNNTNLLECEEGVHGQLRRVKPITKIAFVRGETYYGAVFPHKTFYVWIYDTKYGQ